MKKKLIITTQDLMHIHSSAVNFCIALPKESEYHKDNGKLQAYSFTVALVNFLNSKDLLDVEVDVPRGYDEVN